ncbi:hypothetical protein GPECTOR_5g295 [Gonium pectorale]|uniref:Uncharacterized protein n=1 Tax=Gonium pectorale TaxID=33097 RepID=A0A150GWH0_GONPE|nr:hypothetical protein GPECTOR_5g295 [Gonium pectorale]|eukprot:KXZ54201.1 hypothetical protein GPECTOR_5g295 [Gonium pectorale]
MRAYAINNKPSIRYVPVPEPELDDFRSEPTTYTQLLAAIRSAKTLKRLQHLVSTYSDRLDAVHVAAAVARLPRLIKYKPSDLVDRRDAVVVPSPNLQHVRRKHGAQPRAGHLDAGAKLAAQLDGMLPAHVHNFFPRQAACTLWAFGELHRRGVVQRMESLPDVLLSVTRGGLEPLRVHAHGVDFAQLVQGLAKLGHNDPELLARLEPLLLERLGSMQQRELTMVAWGLASMGGGSAQLFNAIADQLLRTSTAFLLPSGCAGALWAFAKAGVRRPELFASLAGSMVGQALLLAPQDATTALWACTKLGFRDNHFFAVLGDAVLRSLPSCSDLEVSSVVESLAALGYHHAPLLDAIAASILAEPVIGAQPVCIARVLAAYGRLGRRGPRDVALAAALAAALVPRMPIVKEDTLALACAGLQLFGYQDPEVLAAYASRAELLVPHFSDAQLLSVLRLLSSAGVAHYQLAVASARHLHASIIPGSKHQSKLAIAVELLYLCARQGVEDPAAADAVLQLVASYEEVLRPVDAGRLFVVGQVMNKQGLLLTRAADIVARQATQLDEDTARSALASARALGRTDVAGALSSVLQ